MNDADWLPFDSEPLDVSADWWPYEDGQDFVCSIPPLVAKAGLPELNKRTWTLIEKAEHSINDYMSMLGEQDMTELAEALCDLMESLNSSRIEEIHSGYEFLVQNVEDGGTTGSNLRAIASTHEHIAGDKISVDLLNQIQDIMIKGTTTDRGKPLVSGKPRPGMVFVGNHIPPMPHRVEQYLDDLVSFVDRDGLDDIPHVALAHSQFESIHPYEDGNGRTGRLLSYAMMSQKYGSRIPMSVGLYGARSKYYQSLRDYQDSNCDTVVALHAVAIAEFCNEAQRFFPKIADAVTGAVEKLDGDSDVEHKVALLASSPVFTVSQYCQWFGLTVEAAETQLEKLVDIKFLSSKSSEIRETVYTVMPVESICSQLEYSVRSKVARRMKVEQTLTKDEMLTNMIIGLGNTK